jgi:Lipocalin-like domain
VEAFRIAMLAVVVTVSAASQTRPAAQNGPTPGSDKESLIGAWHLVSITGPDGKPVSVAPPKGMLIYTRDGHMSVQLMYPKTANARSNEYVQDGYEASFGSYDVDEATRMVTHHVQGSITRDLLVGKDLPRVYQFSADGHLTIRSARPDEHWSVTWEHY